MSYHPNQQRATYDDGMANIRGERSLPKINDKRFSDVIDYNQPRPQSGFQQQSQNRYEEEEDQYDNRNYSQNQNQRQQNTYGGKPEQARQNGGGYDNYSNNMPNQAGYGSNGFSNKSQGLGADGDGQAIQLIRADPRSGKFALNEEVAAELAANYEGNVAFVTVAGKYRTGKSFLLNKLLGLKGDGFVVDPSTEACTQGIWMWSKPLYSEKDNMHIFFLDTEGTNSVEKSATHDAKIFSLALLMSSYFIYNSVGNIDENSINDLSLTTQLSKNIAISTEENSQHALSYYTPKFLWVLRDFTLELQDAQGRPISSNQYLENALTDQSTYSKATEANKKVRQALLNYFKERECMTFVRPANDERDLKRLNTLQPNQIRPEFMKQLGSLKDKIFAKATPKQLKGVNLNMRMYTAMLQKYVEAINQGSVPNISSAWDHLVENECRESYEQSVELYDIALKEFFFNEERAKSIDELYNILKNIRDSALEKYNKMTATIERNDIAGEFKTELKDYIDKKEQQVVAINEELNQTNNEELLHTLSQAIKNNITSGYYNPQNIQDYHDDMNQFLNAYDAEAQGFSKTTTLIKFMDRFQPEVISSLMLSLNKAYQSNQKNYEVEKARFLENEKNLKMNLDILKEKEKSAADQLARVKGEKNELSSKTAKLGEQLARVKEEEEGKIGEERTRAKLEANKLKEKEKEVQELSRQNKELMAEIAKRKNACCNMF